MEAVVHMNVVKAPARHCELLHWRPHAQAQRPTCIRKPCHMKQAATISTFVRIDVWANP